MAKILGEAVIRYNGKQFKSKPGATLDPGGYVSTPHEGPGRIWGLSKKWAAGSLSFSIASTTDLTVVDVRKIDDATITFKGNNGESYMLTECAAGEAITLSEDSGEISANFNFVECVPT